MLLRPLTPSLATVTGVIDEAPLVKTMYVALMDFPDPAPGQFNMVYAKGLGEVPISISDAFRRGDKLVIAHTIRSVGAVTKYFITSIEVGSQVGIRGPYGRGWPLEEVKGMDVLIVGGGIGLAPLRPIIRYVEAHRDSFGKILILYGARTPHDLLYKYELGKYADIPNSVVKISIDKPYEGWTGYVGFVTDLINYIDLDPGKTAAYICGPEVMMKVAVRRLIERGLKADKIFLSLERRMRCGMGVCGTCQFGHYFVCKDGPVFSYYELMNYLWVDGI
ncbi:MAG: FAD/NAD(P)-binding protein [Desulfurococcaceae archaeon]